MSQDLTLFPKRVDSKTIEPPSGVKSLTALISDTNYLDKVYRCIMVNQLADLKVTAGDGTTATLPQLAPGVWHYIDVAKIFATGSTANTTVIGGY